MSLEYALPLLPPNLAWSTGAYLLLDGVSIPDLPQRLREWGMSTMHKPLYEGTRWAELIDLSPYLIELTGPDDPVLVQYLKQGEADWGFLLFGEGDWRQHLAHLRWLTCVQHPQGQQLLLRLADSSVADALFGHARLMGKTTLFGPFREVLALEPEGGTWALYQRPDGIQHAPASEPYTLDEAELARLGEVRMRQVMVQLDRHMQNAFPHYGSEWTTAQRRARLNELADQAYASGFCSEADLTLYSNLFGLLGDEVLRQYPAITVLLDTRNGLTASQRLQQAADLAYAYALQTRSTS